MNDKRLGTALAEVCEDRLLTDSGALPEGFEFSEGFEQRMRSIIGTERKPFLRGRLKAGLIIAAIFAAGFCLGMAREPLWNYIVQHDDGGRNISFDVNTVKDPKKKIEQVYELGGLPEGYDLVWESSNREACSRTYGLKKGDGAELYNVIFFGQYIPYIYYDAHFSDNARYCFDEDGTQYYVDETPEWSGAVWYQDGYVFLVSGSLPKDKILDLCKTLKKSES
ncbi:MAG: hypothetical protein IKP95_02705 [Ruminococcus sp.]|nr:hypothetical protein [Ruminococcus sp.]